MEYAYLSLLNLQVLNIFWPLMTNSLVIHSGYACLVYVYSSREELQFVPFCCVPPLTSATAQLNIRKQQLDFVALEIYLTAKEILSWGMRLICYTVCSHLKCWQNAISGHTVHSACVTRNMLGGH